MYTRTRAKVRRRCVCVCVHIVVNIIPPSRDRTTQRTRIGPLPDDCGVHCRRARDRWKSYVVVVYYRRYCTARRTQVPRVCLLCPSSRRRTMYCLYILCVRTGPGKRYTHWILSTSWTSPDVATDLPAQPPLKCIQYPPKRHTLGITVLRDVPEIRIVTSEDVRETENRIVPEYIITKYIMIWWFLRCDNKFYTAVVVRCVFYSRYY